MENTYLKTLFEDLERCSEQCKNLKEELEEFLQDYPHIEGINEKFPHPIIHECTYLVGRTSDRLLELKYQLIYGGKNNG